MALDPAEEQTVPVLRTAVMRLARRLRQERQDDELTPSQLAVLGNLSLHGPLTPRDLATIEHVKPPSMSRILAALEEGGWVARQPHPEDGRQQLITMTKKSRHWVTNYRETRDRWLLERLAQFEPQERQLLLRAAPLIERLASEPSPR